MLVLQRDPLRRAVSVARRVADTGDAADDARQPLQNLVLALIGRIAAQEADRVLRLIQQAR